MFAGEKLGCLVIARIRDPEYVNQLDFIKSHEHRLHRKSRPVHHKRNIQYLVEKYTLTDGYFSTGLIRHRIYRGPSSSIIGKNSGSRKDAGQYAGCCHIRNGKIIPRGNTEVEEDDYLYVIGNDETVLKPR